MMFIKYYMVGRALGVAPYSEFSHFFLENQNERRKSSFLISPYNVAYFDLVFQSMFKTKQSLTSDVDR